MLHYKWQKENYTREKTKRTNDVTKNKWKNNFVITESTQSNYFFGYYITYLIYQHINLISGQG